MKQHKTLKGILAAMAAGVSDRPLVDIVALIDNAEVQAISEKRAALLNAPYSN